MRIALLFLTLVPPTSTLAQTPTDFAATRDWLEHNVVRHAPSATPAGQSSLVSLEVDSCNALRATWHDRPNRGSWRTLRLFIPLSWNKLSISTPWSLPQGFIAYSGDQPKRYETAEAWPAGTATLGLSYKEKVVQVENPQPYDQDRSGTVFFFESRAAAEEARAHLVKLRTLCEGS